MKPGEIIYRGKSSKGKNFLIRYIDKNDSSSMCDYINELSKELTFISYQGEHVSFKEEIKYLRQQLQN
jgi:hypothetical protein